MKYGPKTRILAVGCAMGVVFSIFSFRLIQLHVVRHDELSALAASNHVIKVPISSRRGTIVDAKGEVLADNVPAKKVVADCTHVTDLESTVRVVADALELPETEVREKLASDRRYVILKRQVPDTVVADLRRRLVGLGLRGIYFENDSIRVYPNGPLLCHVIGFVNRDFHGVQGVERAMDEFLAGEDGYRFIERDRTGREIVPYRGQERAPRNGATVRLTIDMGLQQIVEQALDEAVEQYRPRSAVVVLLRPRTGEVLAMATRPNFDLGNLGIAKDEQMKNRAILDQHEPGSTFKIVVAGAALSEGITTPETMIYCENGRFQWGGRILRDHRPYANLSVNEVISKSSNIGVAKLAIQMGPERVHEYIRRFGFGERSGLGLPGEIGGTVHPPHRWSKLSITRVPMGHEIAVTPLQLAVAVATIANQGVLMKPRIVSSVTDPVGGQVAAFPPTRVREAISREAANKLKDAMVGAVLPGGTATRAKVDFYRVAGKTGTAQRVDPKGGYTPGKYVLSFIGFMPADYPEIAAVVLVDDAVTEPGMNYGGLVAAPIFARIAARAARHLDLPPGAEPVLRPSPLARAGN